MGSFNSLTGPVSAHQRVACAQLNGKPHDLATGGCRDAGHPPNQESNHPRASGIAYCVIGIGGPKAVSCKLSAVIIVSTTNFGPADYYNVHRLPILHLCPYVERTTMYDATMNDTRRALTSLGNAGGVLIPFMPLMSTQTLLCSQFPVNRLNYTKDVPSDA